MLISFYIHAEEENARTAGEEAGLEDADLEIFERAGYEHKMTYFYDSLTGQVQLVAVDDQTVNVK